MGMGMGMGMGIHLPTRRDTPCRASEELIEMQSTMQSGASEASALTKTEMEALPVSLVEQADVQEV